MQCTRATRLGVSEWKLLEWTMNRCGLVIADVKDESLDCHSGGYGLLIVLTSGGLFPRDSIAPKFPL
jgi:hypothetical protein